MRLNRRKDNKISARVISVDDNTFTVEMPIAGSAPKVGENIIVTVPSTRKKLVVGRDIRSAHPSNNRLSDVVTRGIVTKTMQTGKNRVSLQIKVRNTNDHKSVTRLNDIKNKNRNVNIRTIGIIPDVQ